MLIKIKVFINKSIIHKLHLTNKLKKISHKISKKTVTQDKMNLFTVK
jgi:hypothetical protein